MAANCGSSDLYPKIMSLMSSGTGIFWNTRQHTAAAAALASRVYFTFARKAAITRIRRAGIIRIQCRVKCPENMVFTSMAPLPPLEKAPRAR